LIFDFSFLFFFRLEDWILLIITMNFLHQLISSHLLLPLQGLKLYQPPLIPTTIIMIIIISQLPLFLSPLSFMFPTNLSKEKSNLKVLLKLRKENQFFLDCYLGVDSLKRLDECSCGCVCVWSFMVDHYSSLYFFVFLPRWEMVEEEELIIIYKEEDIEWSVKHLWNKWILNSKIKG